MTTTLRIEEAFLSEWGPLRFSSLVRTEMVVREAFTLVVAAPTPFLVEEVPAVMTTRIHSANKCNELNHHTPILTIRRVYVLSRECPTKGNVCRYERSAMNDDIYYWQFPPLFGER